MHNLINLNDMNITPLIPNAHVNIVEKTKPIIIPFGPPCCGKLLLIQRLFRYLLSSDKDYHMRLESCFLPTDLCKTYEIQGKWFFDSMFGGYLNHHRIYGPLMFNITYRGSILFSLLYQNGESFFDPYDSESPIRLLEILNTPNKKIWLFLLEVNWRNTRDRDNYVGRIIELSHLFRKTDEVIFVVPKIDQYHILYNGHGRVDLNVLWRQVNNQYYRLFEHFKTKNFFWRFFKPYTFGFCAFSSGLFSKADNRIIYISGEDFYPEKLWKLIKKHL